MVSRVVPGSMFVLGSPFVRLFPPVGLDCVIVTSSGVAVGEASLSVVVLVVGGAGVVGVGVEGDCEVGCGVHVVGGFVGRDCVVRDSVVDGGSVGTGAIETEC